MAERILVIDQERTVQAILERAGYEVLTAPDGIDILDKAQTEKPDLIVCDSVMPRMDGFELVRNLKAADSTCRIGTLMIGPGADTDVHRGWTSGVDCYLTSPPEEEELRKFVRKLLRTREPV